MREFIKFLHTKCGRALTFTMGLIAIPHALTGYFLPTLSLVIPAGQLAIPFVMGILLIVLLLAISGAIFLEVKLRQMIVKEICTNGQAFLIKPTHRQEWESVHVTGAIEKFVWSFTDFLKEGLSFIIALAILALSNIMGFLLSLVICIIMVLMVKLFLPTLTKLRHKLALAQRLVVRVLTKKTASRPTLNIHRLMRLVSKLRFATILTRGLMNLASNIIGAIVLLFGVYLLTKGQSGGLFIILTSIPLIRLSSKLADSFTVAQSEALHFSMIAWGRK